MRDFWYEHCHGEYALPSDRLSTIEDKLDRLATKKDLEQLSVRNDAYILADARGRLEGIPYSFATEEYVHPRIVQELYGWISDATSTVAAVDLTSANSSNQFFGSFDVREGGGRVWVEYADPDGGYFHYSYLASSPSGVHMVECSWSGGGSGVFCSVILLALHRDRALDVDSNGQLATRERVLLKTLGSISLGDRYSGQLSYGNGMLEVGPDVGWFKRGEEASKSIPIL